jgi:hypothetical protein
MASVIVLSVIMVSVFTLGMVAPNTYYKTFYCGGFYHGVVI